MRSLVFAALLMSLPAAAEYAATDVTNGGTIKGKITYNGKPPAPKKIAITKDPKICGASREGASQRSSQEHPRSGGQEVQKRRYHEKRLRAVGQCKEIRKTNRAGERSD